MVLSIDKIAHADGNRAANRTISLKPTPTAGVYTGTVQPASSGSYTLRFAAADATGKELGTDELPLTVVQWDIEAERIARDDLRLSAIANRSGGRYVQLAALPDVLDVIIDRDRDLDEAPSSPTTFRLHDFTLGFLAFVGLVTIEWFLRRSWQLQ